MRKSAAMVAATLLLNGSALADGVPQPEPAPGPRLALLNGSVVQIVPGQDGQ